MIFRVIIALLILCGSVWLIRLGQITWDPLFVTLIFLCFLFRGYFFTIVGIFASILIDHLIGYSFPFYTISGIIIFTSAAWLKAAYPIARKPLPIIMAPIYSQFLWFMLLFGYYISEGKGAVGAGYFAPSLIGNTLITVSYTIVFFGILARRRKRDFSRELLAR